MSNRQFSQYNNSSTAYKFDEFNYSAQKLAPNFNAKKRNINSNNEQNRTQAPLGVSYQNNNYNNQRPITQYNSMETNLFPNSNKPYKQSDQQFVSILNHNISHLGQPPQHRPIDNPKIRNIFPPNMINNRQIGNFNDYYFKNNYNNNPNLRKKNNRGKTFIKFLMLVIVITFLGLILLNKLFFTASYYKIEGLQQYTDNDVLTLAGLEINQSLSSIKPKVIKERIESTGRLILEKFEFRYPSGVYMYVKERVPAATLSSNGYIYTLDKDGVVLSLAYGGNVNPSYIEIKGCIIRELGGNIKAEFRYDWQRKAFITILNELYKLNVTDIFQSISLVENNNIYLTTRDGSVVRLGNIEKIGAKIRSAMSVYKYLIDNQKDPGRIDVTIPENPIYSVENIKSSI